MNDSNKCIICGKDKGRNKLYCSVKCRTIGVRNKRKCIICGKEFWAAPSSKVKTCNPECEKINRSCAGKSESNKKKLELAWEKFKTNPNSGDFETNSRAKSWILKDPAGNIYEINNLSHWARKNADKLPCEPSKFARGIVDVKRALLGAKGKATSYKGWKLLNFFEENKARKDFLPTKKAISRVKMPEEERLRRKREREKKRNQKLKELKQSELEI